MSPSAVTQQPNGAVGKPADLAAKVQKADGPLIDLALRQFRCLIADLCQQFNGGHPGYGLFITNTFKITEY